MQSTNTTMSFSKNDKSFVDVASQRTSPDWARFLYIFIRNIRLRAVRVSITILHIRKFPNVHLGDKSIWTVDSKWRRKYAITHLPRNKTSGFLSTESSYHTGYAGKYSSFFTSVYDNEKSTWRQYFFFLRDGNFEVAVLF